MEEENKKETFLQKLRRKRKAKQIFDKVIEKKEEVEEKPKVLEPEVKKEGLKNKIDDIHEKLEVLTQEKQVKKKLKKKQFKVPMKIKGQLKKLAMKNKVQVLLLQNNRNMKPTIGEIKEGMLNVGGKSYNGAADFVWLWNGKFPTVIVAEWDINPLSASRLLDVTAKNKSWSDPQKIIIRAVEFKQTLDAGKKMSGKAIVWIGIAVVIVGYVLFAGG